jgi:hypothetical protein
MARSGRTGRSSASDVMAVMMAHPADGPASVASKSLYGVQAAWTRRICGRCHTQATPLAATVLKSGSVAWRPRPASMPAAQSFLGVSRVAARTVFGRGAGGHVHVDGVLAKVVGGQGGRPRRQEAAREGVRDGGALLHHVAQLPCSNGSLGFRATTTFGALGQCVHNI